MDRRSLLVAWPAQIPGARQPLADEAASRSIEFGQQLETVSGTPSRSVAVYVIKAGPVTAASAASSTASALTARRWTTRLAWNGFPELHDHVPCAPTTKRGGHTTAFAG